MYVYLLYIYRHINTHTHTHKSLRVVSCLTVCGLFFVTTAKWANVNSQHADTWILFVLLVAPRSEFSHIQSPVSLVTYLFSQGSLVAGVPPPTQPCLVWTSAAVLMTPDPDHILWSGRSAALRRDALVSDIPTWQVAKTEGREPDCCCCWHSLVEF